MVNNDQNIIKPVESLQNVTNLANAKRREERKKQQNSHQQEARQRKPIEDELNQLTEEDLGSEIAENDQDENSIDYRA